MTETSWLDRTVEQAIEPELIICDPHHHLWEFPTSIYLVDDLLAEFEGGHQVVKTVFVECQQHYRQQGPEEFYPVGETEFVEKITKGHNTKGQSGPAIAAGIVGFADLTLGEPVAAVLEAHVGASTRFRGIRHASAWHESDKVRNGHTNPTKELLQDASFRAGLGQVEKMNLSFDAWLYFDQIPQLTELARAHPDLPIVLNHIGGVVGIGPYAGKREEVFDHWVKNISELATCPNVVVKLGGLTMTMCGFGWHKQESPPGSEQLAEAMAPYYQTCIERFGPERCMFESNFPVDQASASYTVLWNAFKRLSQGYSTSEREALFHDTASRIYRI
jgi:L-fuconolactonase